MERIVIVGCGGSGKTRLARQLAEQLDLPVTHLDGVFYDADWNPMDRDDFAARQHKLVAEPRWIIEGNYATTLPIRLAAADTVVYLDLPAWTCLWGIAQRRWRYRGGQYTAAGVFDRITWGFVRYILCYRRSMAPRVRALIAEHATHARVVTLASRREVGRSISGHQLVSRTR